MKDIIVVVERDGENEMSLAMENINKIPMTEVGKMLGAIDHDLKYNQAISNIDIDVTEDLELTSIKKYYKCISQI